MGVFYWGVSEYLDFEVDRDQKCDLDLLKGSGCGLLVIV